MKIVKKRYFVFDKKGRLKETIESEFDKKETRKKSNWATDLNFANVGYYIATPIILGVFLGISIDNWFKTKPFFTLLLIFFGTVMSFYNLYRLTKT